MQVSKGGKMNSKAKRGKMLKKVEKEEKQAYTEK